MAFVKSRLRQLRLNDDIWEADFDLLDNGVTWLGLVVCPTSGAIFASEICDHPPNVNDLANLLAHAMRRPSNGTTNGVDEPSWLIHILPHLEQTALYQKWDLYKTFGSHSTSVRQSVVQTYLCPEHRVIVAQLIINDGTVQHTKDHGKPVDPLYSSYNTSTLTPTVKEQADNTLKLIVRSDIYFSNGP